MRYLNAAVAVAAALTASYPAMAASVVNPNNSVTLVHNDALSWTFFYNGFTSSAQVPVPGLTAEITFNFLGRTNNTFNFTYLIRNTVSSAFDEARVTAFGFTADPKTFTATTGVGDVFNVVAAGNQANGLPDLDFCLKDAGSDNNCNGASKGLPIGVQASGSFALTFANQVNTLTLNNFAVRYQGIEGNGFRDGSASGLAAVPEPATWAMMIGGFGLVGAVARRRPRSASPAVA
jgi:hypothetical protein